MNDIGIPLAWRGRALVLPDFLCFELAEDEPEAFVELIRGRYVACLFSPWWGELFDFETKETP